MVFLCERIIFFPTLSIIEHVLFTGFSSALFLTQGRKVVGDCSYTSSPACYANSISSLFLKLAYLMRMV